MTNDDYEGEHYDYMEASIIQSNKRIGNEYNALQEELHSLKTEIQTPIVEERIKEIYEELEILDEERCGNIDAQQSLDFYGY